MINLPKDAKLNYSNARACFAPEETKQPALYDQVLSGYIRKMLATINTHPHPHFKINTIIQMRTLKHSF